LILFYQPLIPEGKFFLDAEESRHCVKVLRRKNGDVIRITDGDGSFYDARISDANQSSCKFTIEKSEKERQPDYSIHIAIAPTKNLERIEWFVEKAVEIGVQHISFVECKHSERVSIKKERIEKIAVSAMKQSLKARLPKITPLTPFDEFVTTADASQKFIAFVDQSNPDHLIRSATPKSSYLILIGPEGDFSESELNTAEKNTFKKVSLGQSRLRTETAGLAACHILNLINS
jgi:16S rRNA (uracil1498-N3)-methyltransferase